MSVSEVVLEREEKNNNESKDNNDYVKFKEKNIKTAKIEKKVIDDSKLIGFILIYLLMILTIMTFALLSLYF